MTATTGAVSTSPDAGDRDRSRHYAAVAAAVIGACFTVHAINGTIIERAFLGFESYKDYADLEKLRDALGSPPWVASGLAHVVTGVAVVVLGVNLARLAAPTSARLAEFMRFATGVAAVGFTMLGTADVQGAGTTRLLADQNPNVDRPAYMALSIIVPVANGVAISAMGWLLLLTAWWLRGLSIAPGWFVVLAFVAGFSGLVLNLSYAPAYLFLYLIWFWSAAALMRANGRISRGLG